MEQMLGVEGCGIVGWAGECSRCIQRRGFGQMGCEDDGGLVQRLLASRVLNLHRNGLRPRVGVGRRPRFDMDGALATLQRDTGQRAQIPDFDHRPVRPAGRRELGHPFQCTGGRQHGGVIQAVVA